MFEVLVYMFENYFEADNRPDQHTLAKELFAAGFEQEDIDGAFDWFNALENMSQQGDSPVDASLGLRVYTDSEIQKISGESLSFIMFLEQASVLTHAQRELVIDRIMALPQPEVSIDETRWIVLMALWNQGKTHDYLFVEDAIFSETRPVFH